MEKLERRVLMWFTPVGATPPAWAQKWAEGIGCEFVHREGGNEIQGLSGTSVIIDEPLPEPPEQPRAQGFRAEAFFATSPELRRSLDRYLQGNPYAR